MKKVNEGFLISHVLNTNGLGLEASVDFKDPSHGVGRCDALPISHFKVPIFLVINVDYDCSGKISSIGERDGWINHYKRMGVRWNFFIAFEPGLFKVLLFVWDDLVKVLVGVFIHPHGSSKLFKLFF